MAHRTHNRLKQADRWARAYREILETACVETHGEVNVLQCHAIDTAVACERASAVAHALLYHEAGDMDAPTILAIESAHRGELLQAERRESSCGA